MKVYDDDEAWSDWSGFSGCATFDRVWRRPRRFRVYCVVKGALRMSRRLIIAFASSRAPTKPAPRPQQAMFSTAQHYPTQSTQHRRSVLIEPSDSPTVMFNYMRRVEGEGNCIPKFREIVCKFNGEFMASGSERQRCCYWPSLCPSSDTVCAKYTLYRLRLHSRLTRQLCIKPRGRR